jgi:hypothetical protein
LALILVKVNYGVGSIATALRSKIVQMYNYDFCFLDLSHNKHTIITPFQFLNLDKCLHKNISKSREVCLDCGAYLDQIGCESKKQAFIAHLLIAKELVTSEELLIRVQREFKEPEFVEEFSQYNYCRVYRYNVREKNKVRTKDYLIHFTKEARHLKDTIVVEESFNIRTFLKEEYSKILLINPDLEGLIFREQVINIVSNTKVKEYLEKVIKV